MIIQFAEPINASVQIGDNAWYALTNSQGVPGNTYQTANTNSVLLIGVITAITSNSITVASPVNAPLAGAFIMFSKDDVVNRNNVLGYYAKIKMINYSREKIELFAVGSEIGQSSK